MSIQPPVRRYFLNSLPQLPLLSETQTWRSLILRSIILIDSNAFRYIQKIFSAADLSKIHRLSDMVKGTYNLLHDKNGIPHIPKTLRSSLNYDESEFSRFLKRLHTKSIINYLFGYKNGRKYKWIMLNPTLARKSKTFHKDCLNAFDDLSKKEPTLKFKKI